MIKDRNLVLNQESRLGSIQQRKFQALVWCVKDCHHCGLVITATAWTAAELTSSITSINIESPSEGDIKVPQSGKVATGQKWTTWDFKWEDYIGSMVRLLGVPLDCVTRHDMLSGWTAANEFDCLKYQAM